MFYRNVLAKISRITPRTAALASLMFSCCTLGLAGCIEKQTTHAGHTPAANAEKSASDMSAASKQPAAVPARTIDDPLAKLSDRLNGAEPSDPHPLESALNGSHQHSAPESSAKEQKGEKKQSPVFVNCGAGTVVAGKAPPEGTSQWCEKPAKFGSGEKEGPYIRWDRKGAKVLEMTFHKGKPNGPMQTFFPDGQPAELRHFRDGVLDGQWVRWDKSGVKLAEGMFFNGKKNGQFTYYGDGSVVLAQGSFREDVRNGVWIRFYGTGGTRSKVTYREGEKEGLSEEYYASGQLSSRGAYHLNKTDGPWVFYYPNGKKKAEGSFAAGRRSGVWDKYRPDGRTSGQRDLGDRSGPGGRVPGNPQASNRDKAGFVGM